MGSLADIEEENERGRNHPASVFHGGVSWLEHLPLLQGESGKICQRVLLNG